MRSDEPDHEQDDALHAVRGYEVGARSFTLANEFAAVQVSLDDSGNGPRLAIRDLRTGRCGYVDPLHLETLVWLSPRDLETLLDPGVSRWA